MPKMKNEEKVFFIAKGETRSDIAFICSASLDEDVPFATEFDPPVSLGDFSDFLDILRVQRVE
jgi:hypothetical protein